MNNSNKKSIRHNPLYLKEWMLPYKKMNLCVCGAETKSRLMRFSSEGSYEIFCKYCRDLGEQE